MAGYARDKMINTFAGVFPASDPKYVLVVTLDEPKATSTGPRSAPPAWTAAPLFAKVIRRARADHGLASGSTRQRAPMRRFTRWS